jgi:hypothetical protein
MPRKPVARRLISEHDVLGWPPQKSRPPLFCISAPRAVAGRRHSAVMIEQRRPVRGSYEPLLRETKNVRTGQDEVIN